jgi:hypothetical protein
MKHYGESNSQIDGIVPIYYPKKLMVIIGERLIKRPIEIRTIYGYGIGIAVFPRMLRYVRGGRWFLLFYVRLGMIRVNIRVDGRRVITMHRR